MVKYVPCQNIETQMYVLIYEYTLSSNIHSFFYSEILSMETDTLNWVTKKLNLAIDMERWPNNRQSLNEKYFFSYITMLNMLCTEHRLWGHMYWWPFLETVVKIMNGWKIWMGPQQKLNCHMVSIDTLILCLSIIYI